jgi:uncharacterized protein (UPF0305 family)
MEDFEVRQAFAIIKDRVNEIKQDQDWKEKIEKEWKKQLKLSNKWKKRIDNKTMNRNLFIHIVSFIFFIYIIFKESGKSQRLFKSIKLRIDEEKNKEERG